MRSVTSKAELRNAVAAARRDGRTIGLVPTMGYFHEGHLSLMRAARAECGFVVVSLFVNPTQFAPGEDFDAYPRDSERDSRLADESGVDMLWTPEPGEMYPEGFGTWVEVTGLTDVLCGDPARRGVEHFRGVTTVVTKLLNCAQPDLVFIGQKDAQQALVIRRMVRDLDFPVEIRIGPTVREPDGLAMSSRNSYLSDAEREHARSLSRALARAESAVAAGTTAVEDVLGAARTEVPPDVELEYLEARNAEDLSVVDNFNGRPVLVAIAARVGQTRLIDNTIIQSTPAFGRRG